MDSTDAFIRLTELEHKVTELQSKVGFYQQYVQQQQGGHVEQFLKDVHFLALAKADELVPKAARTQKPDGCSHDDVIIFASIGMAQCRRCSTNLDRTFFEKRDEDLMTIADIVGVSIPEEPRPLNPGIAPNKRQFTEV